MLIFVLISGAKTSNNENHYRTQLSVAMFAWIPEMANAFQQMEKDFEAKHPSIDLEITGIDPYATDGYGIYSKTNEFYKFDIVEIDLCMFDDMFHILPPSMEPLPSKINEGLSYYEGIEKLSSLKLKYFLPHWLCGNLLVTDKSNPLAKLNTFSSILGALQNGKSSFFANFYGKTTLGEFYADAMLDNYGADSAKKHLIGLATKKCVVNGSVIDKLESLFKVFPTEIQKDREKYSKFSYLFPQKFYQGLPQSVLLGYSERSFYVERAKMEKELDVKGTLSPNDYKIRQFPFSDDSKGTPNWIDGFVIPGGKSFDKTVEISDFLKYAISADCYSLLNKSESYPGRYLLPAYSNVYNNLATSTPLLSSFKEANSNIFIVDSTLMYRGMRIAGEAVNERLEKVRK